LNLAIVPDRFIVFRHLAVMGCTEAMVATRGFAPKHERLLAPVHERMKCPPASAKSTHLERKGHSIELNLN
jgi:hypothetical protein